LKRRGIDVTTTPEAGLLHAIDELHVAYAQRENRVIFTQDKDFLRLHATGEPHRGIAYCKKGTLSIGKIIEGLILVWEIYDPAEMVNRVEYL
jgi:predicted nuclease of predicted toxin-antitoxin system